MSKICTKCEKAVYPLEELKCLDKVWHKSCFRCTECGMLLTMKNYKGYNRQPYCVAHYPKTKATAVAETPELARVAQNTKQQSLVKYHEEFEKKIKGSKIEVADDQETQRVKRVNALVSQLEYKGKKVSTAPIPANKPRVAHRPITEGLDSNCDKLSPFTARTATNSTVYTSDGNKAVRSSVIGGRIGSIADYDPMNEDYGSLAKGYKPDSHQSSSVQLESDQLVTLDKTNKQEVQDDNHQQELEHHSQHIAEQINGDNKKVNKQDEEEEKDEKKEQAPVMQPEVVRTAEALFDMVIESVERDFREHKVDQPPEKIAKSEVDVIQKTESSPEPQEIQSQFNSSATEIIGVDDGEGGEIITTPLPGEFVALYDYEAQDVDEVTFAEDDIIIEVEKIDDGWLLGTVAKTGQRGMLPANYVQFYRN